MTRALRSAPPALLLAAMLMTACGEADIATASPSDSPSPTSPTPEDPLPEGFPVMPDAEPRPIEEDDWAIRRWRIEEFGGAAYDYYLAELPAAGFRISASAPGGAGASIRFEDPDGVEWQLDIVNLGDGLTDGTELSLGPPHP